MRCRLFLSVVVFGLFYALAPRSLVAAEREVSFKTEDGWTIYGMLNVPESAKGKLPAVLLLHAFAHDRDAFGQYLYPGLAQILGGRELITLRIDLRGRGRSVGPKELHAFSPEELSKLSLDVQAAMGFLSAQPSVDSSSLGILAEEESTEAAVMGSSGDPRVKGIVLISGRLSETAQKRVAATPDLPLLLIVSKEDRIGFRGAAVAYKYNRSASSRILVFKDLGIATTMFSVWRSEHPKEKPIEDTISDWMVGQLKSAAPGQEVSFRTEDGWDLYGTLRTPVTGGGAGSGVVLIHSSFTDRHIFDHLAELMVKRGLVVLNIDTRGRGRSTGRGEFLSLPVEEREKGYLDAKAAVEFLLSRPGVSRIGLLGTDRGANYAMNTAINDARVRAVVLMTTLLGTKDKEEIAKLEIPIIFVASKEIEVAAQAMAEAYAVAKHHASRLLVYEGGNLGYQIFDMDPSLEATLADWMKERLSR